MWDTQMLLLYLIIYIYNNIVNVHYTATQQPSTSGYKQHTWKVEVSRQQQQQQQQ